METFSAVTIVKSRLEQLQRLVTQLEACDPAPQELILVWMTRPSDYSLLKSDQFPIVHKFVTGETLPIAKARNKGIAAVSSERFVYMNVDAVIPPDIFSQLQDNHASDTIYSTHIQYVTKPALNQRHTDLLSDTQHHVDCERKESDYSALFCMRKQDFETVGGFDERFDGFGINDEDFFTAARHSNLTVTPLDAVTFVQYRPHYRCPLNHFLDFSRNAEIYRRKWQEYPCKDVLMRYAEQGYINKDFQQAGIKIDHLPTDTKDVPLTPEHAYDEA
ncbi:galactosyltransferase-related protein [Alteromonas sp. ASW11-19]|uniref:Galactosyltransferase-related protein n=1 Tax=Alteromonas salexigens TaxID=2982530 RepID=A0ABT2VRU0_9ALTE|nr:galactosyltransferase-related protein [Alteromonas salexigens]MCU7556040.1 galactosyltransferase-related protein [Alteromonas salexigens]